MLAILQYHWIIQLEYNRTNFFCKKQNIIANTPTDDTVATTITAVTSAIVADGGDDNDDDGEHDGDDNCLLWLTRSRNYEPMDLISLSNR